MGIPLSFPQKRRIRKKLSNVSHISHVSHVSNVSDASSGSYGSKSSHSFTFSRTSFEADISQYYGGDSVLSAFRYIEGRRYHNNEDARGYCFPNDNQELKRMQLSHSVFKETWESNFSAPVAEKLAAGGVHVFDVGCGPGTWCLEMSKDFPRATFIGLDISPTFSLDEKPPNVGFLQCNMFDGLPFPNETFYYCWQKFMLSSVTDKRWIGHIKEMVRVTKRGGWIELMEVNIEFFNAGVNLQTLSEACCRYYNSKNLLPLISQYLPRYVEENGELENVTKEERMTRLGGWAGAHGERAMTNVVQAYQALKPVVRPVLGISEDAYNNMVNALSHEATRNRTFMKTFRIYAQKRL